MTQVDRGSASARVGAATPGTRPRPRRSTRKSGTSGSGARCGPPLRGTTGLVAWWHRPRTQRWLGWLETTAAVAVLPLLAGVLGVYAAAADAGAPTESGAGKPEAGATTDG